MKRNASGYPSSMFLGSDCTWDSQGIANLFVGFFQKVNVRDDWISDSNLPTPGDGHKMSAIEVSEDEVECVFLGLDVNKGPCPDGITPAILKRLASVVKLILTFVFNLSKCQIRGLFVRLDSISFRGSARESLGTNILHFGY
jgi:hypothetical protein